MESAARACKQAAEGHYVDPMSGRIENTLHAMDRIDLSKILFPERSTTPFSDSHSDTCSVDQSVPEVTLDPVPET
jgi:hypothetical protein